MAHTISTIRVGEGDPRILNVQVERAANAVRDAVLNSCLWICLFALVCSEWAGFLGAVPLTRSVLAVVFVTAAAFCASIVLAAYQRTGGDAKTAPIWRGRLLSLSVILSAAWGAAPWLLWDAINSSNHVFIALVCLAIVPRFMVNRANHTDFFFATFLPMASLLFIRLVTSFQPLDLILAALVPLYGIQTFLDSREISKRWDEQAQMRFSFEDMSRELEETRDEALTKRSEAEAANASKTAFLANMSHELRTPLNAILGFSEIIARECLGPVGSPRYREYAGDIHTSGTHLLSLINDLLDVAKIEAGKMEIELKMLETARTLESALKFVAVHARERNQHLTISVDDPAAMLCADERAFKQIVINLGSNAVKFTPAGGRIEVKARRSPMGEFELSVADNGCGIPKEKIDRIFKPFTRVDNRYENGSSGTGLGLALVRGLAELHGGRAWMESEEGKGTCVYVVLPMKIASEGAKRLASA